MIGYALAGLAKGAGEGIVAEARAKREAALKALERQQQLDDVASARAFATSERIAGQEFQSAEAQRKAEMERAKKEATAPRPMTKEEKTEWGLDDRPWMFKDGAPTLPGGGGTTINVDTGTIPAGHRAIRDEQGRVIAVEPLPGSPQAADASKRETAETARTASEKKRSGLIAEEIDRAMELISTDGVIPATGLGGKLKGLPGTDAKALSTLLDTIRANIGFSELNKMRQESPTGGALGQVTERELAYLQAVAGSLDQEQSEEQLRYNLNRLWNTYMDVIHGDGQGPERRPADWKWSEGGNTKASAPANAAMPRVGVVEDGYRFKGGDPSDPKSWEKVN